MAIHVKDQFQLNYDRQVVEVEWMSQSHREADPAELVAEAQRRARETGWDVMYILCMMLGGPYNPDEAGQTFNYTNETQH